jgi:arylsulfatase A-like enzyme
LLASHLDLRAEAIFVILYPMGAGALKRYGSFVGQVCGAACLGGVLAAAGEYVLGAALGRGPFWGQPRFLYQLIIGAEVLWAAVISGLVFAAGGSVYYLIASRVRKARPASPLLLAAAVALTGAAFFYFLTTRNFAAFAGKPAAPVVGIYLLALVIWFVAGGALYLLINTLVRRLRSEGALPVYLLRVMALGLLVPLVVAEGWAMWQARTPSPRRPDIYLVVMDAFRADRLSYYDAPRYLAPTLEVYGLDAAVFKDAYTVSSWTKPAVVSTFTATYPGTHGVDASFIPLPEDAVTLADVLRRGGYRTICVSANPNITRPAGMTDGFDIMDDTNHGPLFNAAGPPVSCMRPFVAFEGLRPLLGPLFIRSIDGINVNARLEFWSRFVGERPAFYYIHYMEPHIPNLPRPEYAYDYQPYLERVNPDRLMRIASGPYFWHEVLKDPSYVPEFDRDEVALAKALYDADIRRMDVVIEGLLENFVARPGRDGEAVIVITADHGEEFLEHGRWLHGAGMHHEVARVPLIIKAPGCKPGVIEGPVNLVDVPRTLASLAGVEAPLGWEGLDLTPYIMSGSAVPPRELLLESIHTILVPSGEAGDKCSIDLHGLVAGDYYYLKDENAGLEYLYERARDRWERENLAAGTAGAEFGGVLAESRAATVRLKARAAAKAFRREEFRLTPELEGQLKTLGYLK